MGPQGQKPDNMAEVHRIPDVYLIPSTWPGFRLVALGRDMGTAVAIVAVGTGIAAAGTAAAVGEATACAATAGFQTETISKHRFSATTGFPPKDLRWFTMGPQG